MSKYEIYKHLFRTTSIDEFTSFSTFNYFNRHYSLLNSALILLQRPGATIVRSETSWNKRGRFVKLESSPIIILQPGGPVAPVYDYSDTYGQESFEEVTHEKLKQEYLSTDRTIFEEYSYRHFVSCAEQHGILCNEKAFGDRLKGLTQILEVKQYIVPENNKKEAECIEANHKITINSNSSYHEKCLTFFHELAHLYCGHLSGARTKWNMLPEYAEGLDHNIKEYEAELTCRIICDKFGFFYDNWDYLKQHLVDGKPPEIRMQAVFGAADKITRILKLDKY